jgi:SAM-dependent methyltransferase
LGRLSGFDAHWLDLRQAADRRARESAGVERRWRPDLGSAPLGILDLACGTGANLRYLAPRIGGSQDWLLTDADADLLAALPGAMARWAAASGCRLSKEEGALSLAGPGFRCRIRLLELDLASGLHRLSLGEIQLVTASALLDLVSAAWLDALVRRCREAGADLLFALTYDGRMHLAPPDALDGRIAALVNAHQRGDKGFGPALGPAAPGIAEALLRARGYRVERPSSDWHIGPGEAQLQLALLRGWADAAAETAPEDTAVIAGWLDRRLALVAAGESRLTVGHQDLLGSVLDFIPLL